MKSSLCREVSFVTGVLLMTAAAAGCSSGASSVTPPVDASVDVSVHVDTGTSKDVAVKSCGAQQVSCGGACVTVSSDPDNCGACGKSCTGGEVCSAGQCTLACAGGATKCGQACVDETNDPANCGGCGTVCTAGQVCSAGKCASTCGGAESTCSVSSGTPYCANEQTDNANCGACGNVCGAGAACVSGKCASSCTAGLQLCPGKSAAGDGGTSGDAAADAASSSSYCADESTDNGNCGACGVVCAAGQACSSGKCALTCAAGEKLCSPDGGAAYCAAEGSDNKNCGGCGVVCGAEQVCSMGVCGSSCVTGQMLCPAVGASPAYCANEATDNTNCGACGKTCGAEQVCTMGVCTSSCVTGQTLCPAAGAIPAYCADEATDNTNCGGCGTTCAVGQECGGGKCACPGSTPNACGTGATAFCTSFQTDNANCGTCGTKCAAGDVCTAGVCTLTCQTGLTNCSNTCTNTTFDPNNCGGCGKACPMGEDCAAGACVFRTTCPANTVCLTNTPNPATVFNTLDSCYAYPNNLVNGIWHAGSNMIIAGHYSDNGYWSYPAYTGNYPALPNNATGVNFSRMVLVAETGTVVHTGQAQYPSAYNQIMLGSINEATGAIGAFTAATYSDNFTGSCNLISASATEFLCFDGVNVRQYATVAGSAALSFVAAVPLTPAPASTCGSYCFGGTFAWDGVYYYFSSNGSSSNNLQYQVYTATGALQGTYTATGNGAIDSTYFDWSVGRYATHDGYGGRGGGQEFFWLGGSFTDDSQCYGPPSPYHT